MNSPERMQQIQELFHAALERHGAARTRLLQQACGHDLNLRSEVEALLAAHDEADGFLENPVIEPREAATLIQPATPTQIISHYEILSLLGRGGMGEVYLAADKSLGRKAALKILPARYTTSADLVQRFEREAKAASALNHPNILTVYEIGQTNDSHFIATEFIAGETLRQRLQQAPLPLATALDIALQIAAALQAAHEAGIIHRDIKPENVMVRPDGLVKVLDFGLAKLIGSQKSERGTRNEEEPLPSYIHPSSFIPHPSTVSGLVMGTPSYMSPEQARGQKVDARTDVWSFGVVLYELVSGARPFGGDTQADLLVSILEREPVPLPDQLPAPLRALIAHALAKEPPQRYATMQELLEELKAFRRKLEFESELKLVAQTEQAEAATIRQSEEAVTLRLPPETATQIKSPAPTAAPTARAVTTPAPRRFPARAVIAGFVLLGVLGVSAWYILRPPPAPPPSVATPATTPQRELTWWLTVQRRQNGKLEQPFPSAGREWFPNGSKFQFNLISPQTGYLYLLNEGPTKGGRSSLNLLYPTPANNNLNAVVAANQPAQTGNYEFDPHQGEEKFWIVWAARPVPEIEAVKATTVRAEIRAAAQSEAIRALLTQHAASSAAQTDEAKEQTRLTASGAIAVSAVKLRHR